MSRQFHSLTLRERLRPLRILQLRWARRWQDWRKGVRFADQQSTTPLPVVVMEHQLVLLRRLGETDPQLQHNKVVNLQLAVRHLHDAGVDPTRLRVVGLGEYQPVADNEDGSARARNRRLEFTLQPVAQRVVKAEFQQ